MAQQIINYGNTANDGTGDPLRDAFIKVDENFNQIWAAGPVGSNVTILNNTIAVTNTNGNLILTPNGVGVIQTNSKLLPRLDNTYDIGNASLRYRSINVGSGGITSNGNITLASIANLVIPGGLNGYVIQTDGNSVLSWVAMPGAGNGSPGGANSQVQYNDNGLFGGSGNLTFNPTTSNLVIGGTTGDYGNIFVRGAYVGAVVADNTLFANSLSINRQGPSWDINDQFLTAPTGADWSSNVATNEEFISSATNGFITLQTYDSTSNLATQLHMNHGLIRLHVHNFTELDDIEWVFYGNGDFTNPGNILTPGNVTANYFIGNGSQLTDLPGGVIQGNIPPVAPNDTTLWWDDITGRLYVWYDDGSGLQWVDAAPAGPSVTYGNANVSNFLASGTNSANIVTSGGIVGASVETSMITSGDSTLVVVNDGLQVGGDIVISGDIIPDASNVYSLGSTTNQWSDLYVSNATIYMNNVPVSLTSGNVLTVNGNAVVTTDADGLANIGNLAIAGADISIADGASETTISISPTAVVGQAFVQIPNDATADVVDVRIHNGSGNIEFGTNGATNLWYFTNDGILTFPSGATIVDNAFNAGSASASVSLEAFSPDGNLVSIIAQGSSSNAVIQTYSNTTTATSNWTFDNTGALTVPGNIVMPGGASLQGDGASPAPSISGFKSASFGEGVTATGNITGGNLRALTNLYVEATNGSLVLGDVTATASPGLSSTSSVTITANRAGDAPQWVFTTNGNFAGTGNITGGNINTTGDISVAGNIVASNLLITTSATIANLTYNNITNLTTANLVLGLGNTQTGSSVNGGGMVVGNTAEASFTYNFTDSSWDSNIGIHTTGILLADGNVRGQDLIANDSITATGNIVGGNIGTTGYVATTNLDVSGNTSISNVTINSYTSVPQLWFKGTLSAAQNITSSTDTVTIWNSNNDPLGWGNVTTGYIVPNKAGWYEITSRVQFDTNDVANSQQQINHQIAVNGNQQAISQLPNLTGTVPVTMIATAMVEINGSTDYITTTSWSGIAGNAQQINGGNTSLLMVRWVST